MTDSGSNALSAKDSQLFMRNSAEQESDMNDISNYARQAPEDIEIISTDDERLKIIGKELADDTGRAIFTTICQKRIISPADIAKTLDISLPLVNWHINRLLTSGLIRIEKLAMSKKNKPVKYYSPTSTIIVIGTELGDDLESEGGSNADDTDNNQVTRRRLITSAIWSRLTKSISAALVSFITATSVIYALIRTAGWTNEASNTVSNDGIKLADPDTIVDIPLAPPIDSLPSFLYAIMPSSVADFVMALIGGALIGATVLIATKMPKIRARS